MTAQENRTVIAHAGSKQIAKVGDTVRVNFLTGTPEARIVNFEWPKPVGALTVELLDSGSRQFVKLADVGLKIIHRDDVKDKALRNSPLVVKQYHSDDVQRHGYAQFNGGDHLCVDLPNDYATVVVKLPCGKQVTVSLIPDTCVDIKLHDGTEDVVPQPWILFTEGCGKEYHYNRAERPPVLATLTLD